MADNIELNPGSGGATVATDDDGTAHHQYVKMEAGADGTFTKILAGHGTASGALRVELPTDGTGLVGVATRTSGGLSIFRSVDLDETEEDVKGTAGQLYGWFMFNAASSVRYVKLYNATAANTTVGSTTPILTIPLPAGGGANVFTEVGIPFSTALCAAATTGATDADTGAPGGNEVIANLFYV